MALPTNPQRVALSTDAGGKNPQFITREWLKFFGEATGTTTSGGTGGSGNPATDLTALTAALNLLAARVTVLEAQVAELRLGYHA
jgi:hypothetical protein